MFTLGVLVVLCVVSYVLVTQGHRKAVESSEASLRAHFDKQGQAGEPARQLMREAGYRV